MTNVLLIGQCTLHWGRMEFGNIGNFYIIEPFIRELRKALPGCSIRTTFQMSARFCESEGITVLPMDWYYGWTDDDLSVAEEEHRLSCQYVENGRLDSTTPYIDEVLRADVVVDFSGDIWGDNANLLGPNRFLVGLYKDRVAQNLGKPVVMLAGSPGPFTDPETLALAKKVYQSFELVTNREPVSTRLLESDGFDISRTVTLPCPAFLFEGAVGGGLAGPTRKSRDRPLLGLIICGWNFTEGPFDKWPRGDYEYDAFAELVEYLEVELGFDVCLLSHSNGFVPNAPVFELKHGRDYYVVKQLQAVLEKRGRTQHVMCLDGVYDAWQTKAIIGRFDMVVSGRVHAAVAALSQCVPTVILDYGHEPKAHKLRGFATIAGCEAYVADPASVDDMREKARKCRYELREYRSRLEHAMPIVKRDAAGHFRLLAEIAEGERW